MNSRKSTIPTSGRKALSGYKDKTFLLKNIKVKRFVREFQGVDGPVRVDMDLLHEQRIVPNLSSFTERAAELLEVFSPVIVTQGAPRCIANERTLARPGAQCVQAPKTIVVV